MTAISLLEECYDMLKELEDAYVRHDGSIALRRKIRRFIKDAAQQGQICTCKRPHHAASHPKICFSCGKPRR